MIDRIDQYQKENTMMFTRIMHKLNEKLSPQDDADENFDHPDIDIHEFPCNRLERLKNLNTVCKADPSAMRILVRK